MSKINITQEELVKILELFTTIVISSYQIIKMIKK